MVEEGVVVQFCRSQGNGFIFFPFVYFITLALSVFCAFALEIV